MTLVDIIRKFDTVPSRMVTQDNLTFQVFTRKNRFDDNYMAFLWQMAGDLQEHLYSFAEGATIEEAKENLKIKILKDANR